MLNIEPISEQSLPLHIDMSSESFAYKSLQLQSSVLDNLGKPLMNKWFQELELDCDCLLPLFLMGCRI